MGDLLAQYFPGLSSMPNLHPLVVHFPIALLTCFLLLDVFGVLARNAACRRVAGALLYFGALFTAVAVGLGLYEAQSVSHGADVHPIMIDHRNHGLAVLGLALVLSLWRRVGGERWSALGTVLHLATAAAMVFILAQGADLGGLMVYGHGVGVRAAGHEGVHAHDHAHGVDHHHD